MDTMFAVTIQDPAGQIIDSRVFNEGSYVIGRTDECDFVLDSTNVSRKHARMFVEAGRCYVEDLGSANGVVVDGQKVVGQRDLGTASQVQIGDHFLFVETRTSRRDQLAPVAQTLFISDDTDHYKIVRINDEFAGEEFSLSEVSNTIGRTDENFILLSDPSISRNHAQVMRNGERYTVVDLGSSNGSRVNGKKIKGAVDLVIGDRVMFGNVEFVFVDGVTKIDPTEYAGKPGSNYVVMIGAAFLGLFLLAALAFLAIGFTQTGDGPSDESYVSDDRTAQLLERAEKKMERRNFDSAVGILTDVLKHEPDNKKAAELLVTAKHEQSAAAQLTAADRLIETGSFEDAIEELKQVPEGSLAYERAQSQIERVQNLQARKLASDADKLYKNGGREELKIAHGKYTEALKILPNDSDLMKGIKRVEKRMTERKVKFKKWAP